MNEPEWSQVMMTWALCRIFTFNLLRAVLPEAYIAHGPLASIVVAGVLSGLMCLYRLGRGKEPTA